MATAFSAATTVVPLAVNAQINVDTQAQTAQGFLISGNIVDATGAAIDLSSATLGYTVQIEKVLGVDTGGNITYDQPLITAFSAAANWVFTGNAAGAFTATLKDKASLSTFANQGGKSFSFPLKIWGLDTGAGIRHTVAQGNCSLNIT